MNYNVDLVYSQYIKPLGVYERIILAQRILNDFATHERKFIIQPDNERLTRLRKFRGIAKNNFLVLNEEDWYKQ